MGDSSMVAATRTAVDVRASRLLLRAVLKPELDEAVDIFDKDVGLDFADVYGVTRIEPDGGVTEIVISQQLIDQVRAL